MMGLYIVFLIIVLVISFVLAPYLKEKQNEYIGRVGEDTTASIVASIGPSVKVFQNVYVPTIKGNTTEIDTVAITPVGVMVFETKNYSGTIYGNNVDRTWRAEVYNRTNEFYNPILQNENHVKFLKKALTFNVPIYSIIVLSDRCTIGDIDLGHSDVKVVKMSDLKVLIMSLINHDEKMMTDFISKLLIKNLAKFSNPNEEVIRKHREYIKNRYS